jgi:hypothetical protein
VVVRGTVATWLGGAGVAGVSLADALRSVRHPNAPCEPLKATYPDARIAIGIADWSASFLTGHTQQMAWQGGCRLHTAELFPSGRAISLPHGRSTPSDNSGSIAPGVRNTAPTSRYTSQAVAC